MSNSIIQTGKLLDPESVSSGGGAGSTLESDVIAMVTVGNIEAGDTISDGTTLDELVRQIFVDTFYPTFVMPSALLSHNQSSLVEIGTVTDVVLTLSLNRGRINGKLVGGVWSPSTLQDYRSGIANNYTIEGNDLDLVNTYTVGDYTVLSGSNSFSGSIDYDEGPQPVDSDGVDYDSSLAAGSVSDGVSFIGTYPVFGTTSNISVYTQQVLTVANTTIVFSMVSEDGVNKQTFEIPDVWNAVGNLEQYNTLSGSWDDIDLSTFTETAVTKTIQGNVVNYRRYTHNGATVGARQLRVSF